MVNGCHLNPFFDISYEMIRLITKKELNINPQMPQKDTSYTVYRSSTNRMILRKGFILSIDSNGVMEYTAGFLSDVTDLYKGSNFNFNAEGPNSNLIIAYHKHLKEYANILSQREIEVLDLIGNGLSSKQIGAQLFISTLTVNKHRVNILNKLESENTILAYNKAVDMGLLKCR